MLREGKQLPGVTWQSQEMANCGRIEVLDPEPKICSVGPFVSLLAGGFLHYHTTNG